MNKKIMITGASGFIGSHLMNSLQDKYDVIGTVHMAGKLEGRRCRICDWSQEVHMDEDVDVLVHTAALNPGNGKNFDEYFGQNVMMARNVISFAREHNIKKIIYMAAVSSYGKVDKVLTEESEHNAVDDYGLSKYVAERLIEASGIPYEILVLPGVAGPGCRPTWLLKTAMSLAKNEVITCYNADGLFNNVVDVRDIAAFVERLISRDGDRSGKYLLGVSEKMKVREILSYMKESLQSSSGITEALGSSNAFILDISHALESGFSPMPLKKVLDGICAEVQRY